MKFKKGDLVRVISKTNAYGGIPCHNQQGRVIIIASYNDMVNVSMQIVDTPDIYAFKQNELELVAKPPSHCPTSPVDNLQSTHLINFEACKSTKEKRTHYHKYLENSIFKGAFINEWKDFSSAPKILRDLVTSNERDLSSSRKKADYSECLRVVQKRKHKIRIL